MRYPVNAGLYWKASQALWRVDSKEARGLDATFAFDWSPPNVNRNYTQLTAGLRFDEPLPLGFHNTMSLAMCETVLARSFSPPACLPGRPSTVLSSTS